MTTPLPDAGPSGADVHAFVFGQRPEDYGLYVRLVRVQPEQAAKWLSFNGHHRKVKQKDVDKYSARMSAGSWMVNGKTIVLDREGRLIGGQHRLHACVKSGVPFDTLVVWGVNPAVLTQESE